VLLSGWWYPGGGVQVVTDGYEKNEEGMDSFEVVEDSWGGLFRCV
jgi:hypothetical protein